MARAKCQCCKKQLDTKEAFKVEVKGKNDYKIALKYGATHIRLGRIFLS